MKKSVTPLPPYPPAVTVAYAAAARCTNGIGDPYAQVLVAIENRGDRNLYLSSSSFVLADAAGQAAASKMMVPVYPGILSPGERGYLYEAAALPRGADGPLTVLPCFRAEPVPAAGPRYAVSDVVFSADQYGETCVRGLVANTSGIDGDRVRVVLVLKGGGDLPLALLLARLPDRLPAGAQAGFQMSTLALPEDVTPERVCSYDIFAYPQQTAGG